METARDLALRLGDLLRREHAALADFLLALATFDERRLWAELGHASLFDFLHRELGLSRSAAFYRKTAVQLVREHPAVADALREGKLCLMTVAEVARVLEPGNAGDLLPRFFGLSKREAKILVASLLPAEAPPVRELVTPVRAVAAARPAFPPLFQAAPGVEGRGEGADLVLAAPAPRTPEPVERAVLPP